MPDHRGMGYTKHHAIIATVHSMASGLARIDRFRDSMSEEHERLLVGPFASPVNHYLTYVLLPDGSKEGWRTSDEGDRIREDFKQMLRAGQIGFVEVAYGGDYAGEVGATIEDASEREEI